MNIHPSLLFGLLALSACGRHDAQSITPQQTASTTAPAAAAAVPQKYPADFVPTFSQECTEGFGTTPSPEKVQSFCTCFGEYVRDNVQPAEFYRHDIPLKQGSTDPVHNAFVEDTLAAALPQCSFPESE